MLLNAFKLYTFECCDDLNELQNMSKEAIVANSNEQPQQLHSQSDDHMQAPVVHCNMYQDSAPSNTLLFIPISMKNHKYMFYHSEPQDWSSRRTDICELVTQLSGRKGPFWNPNKAVKLMACKSQIRKCPNLQ
jgi:hypothetical protein